MTTKARVASVQKTDRFYDEEDNSKKQNMVMKDQFGDSASDPCFRNNAHNGEQKEHNNHNDKERRFVI